MAKEMPTCEQTLPVRQQCSGPSIRGALQFTGGKRLQLGRAIFPINEAFGSDSCRIYYKSSLSMNVLVEARPPIVENLVYQNRSGFSLNATK